MNLKNCLGILFLWILFVVALPSSAVFSADEIPVGGLKETKEPDTSSSYVASLFYKMSGKKPDFALWAQQTPAYLKALPDEKISVLENQTAELESTYNLITMVDPIFVTMKIQLPPYNKVYKGFTIENFTPSLFFGYTWGDENFALVPNAIADRQWLSVPKPQADAFPGFAQLNQLQLQIKLIPSYGDTKTPLQLRGKDHWLILADVQEISLWSWDGDMLLWRARVGQEQGRDQKILDLYR